MDKIKLTYWHVVSLVQHFRHQQHDDHTSLHIYIYLRILYIYIYISYVSISIIENEPPFFHTSVWERFLTLRTSRCSSALRFLQSRKRLVKEFWPIWPPLCSKSGEWGRKKKRIKIIQNKLWTHIYPCYLAGVVPSNLLGPRVQLLKADLHIK